MEVCHYCRGTQHHFFKFFYLAMTQEPDYMPGAQRKAQQQQELSQEVAPASSEVTAQPKQ